MATRLLLCLCFLAICGALVWLVLSSTRVKREAGGENGAAQQKDPDLKQLQQAGEFKAQWDRTSESAAPESAAEEKAAALEVERQEDTPIGPVPTDRAGVLAELRRVNATVATADKRPEGRVVRVRAVGGKVTNKTLAYIGALSDLEDLELNNVAVTDRGIAELRSLAKLRKLRISIRSPPLRGKITDKSLSLFASLTSLEDLAVSDATISEKALEACLKQLSELKSLSVTRTSLTSSWLGALADCKHLSSLTLAVMPAGDSGLEALERVDNLTFLSLCSMDISAAGFAAVGKLKNLRQLSLAYTNVNDVALQELAGLTMLEELDLDRTRITGSGLAGIKNMGVLRELHLGETAIGDLGLEHLAGLTSLKYLSLDRTRVGDAGLVHLQALENLEVLGLEGTHITDAGIAVLGRMSSLREVRLGGTKVSAEKIKELQRTRPKLDVANFD